MSVDFGLIGPAILFCPADRPDRFDKAAARADAVILDLEDAVAPHARPAAREALLEHRLDPARTIVRVNPFGSRDQAADLAAALGAGYGTVMLAKTESAESITAMVAAAAASGASDGVNRLTVVALCETAAGVLAAPVIAALPDVIALMWGAEDLVASLGGTSSRDAAGAYRDIARHARSTVLLSAGAHRKAAIDTVHLDLADHHGLAAEAADAAAIGFAATACVHPDHVAIIRAAYRPSAEELAAAHLIVDAASREGGVFQLHGQMIDEPVIRHARMLVRRASHSM